ncbi:hypothetical protein DPEC_G00054330 [Dallia pectoralis]|uniref:Uncharacterized protein n=1 Tax=Dallia pectoralis TaxID=75939 RepID=A0ACC2H515_DALPE|nr:hypothetical protein DPEC_G00054330 [Dallia pectoralis]
MASRDYNQFKLLHPDRYILGVVDDDVILICHLSPETSAVTMTIRWFKETECIYLYPNGEVVYGDQKEEAAVGLWVRGVQRWLGAINYLQRETQEDKLKRETSAGELVGGETSDTDTRVQLRRRNSMELIPPTMGGESSSPESPVSPSGSELRLVLLGRTGAGRRVVGNTILGTEEFGTQTSTSAVTQRSVRREGEVCGRLLVLVDTPDWFCPGLSLEEIRQDVGLCVRLSAPGPHAFLLVIPVESSKEEERGVLERMEEMFGEGCWGHTVIIFTHDDSLKVQSIEEFLQAGRQDLQQLVKKCGRRYQVLIIKDRTHDTQVPDLLEKVEEMVAENREDFYCSQTYQEADAPVREMERKM